ncbi:hypothetical protein [Aeromicrobium sp.]|nr:hypothetical protein [Aeromicrobium sp.]
MSTAMSTSDSARADETVRRWDGRLDPEPDEARLDQTQKES